MLNSKHIYMSTKRRHLGLGSNPAPPPPALFSVLLPFQWSSGKILPAAIDVKALVSVQQFCWVSEGDVYGSLIYKMVVWLAQSKIRVSSQRGWWCLDHACSVIADISVSPLLVAAWFSFKRVSSALFVSPMYFCPQPQGIS